MTAVLRLAQPLQGVLLCCHADEKAVKAAMKKQPNKGGIYFPITAVQVRMRHSAGVATTQHQQDLCSADC